jgi:hypothetical protein
MNIPTSIGVAGFALFFGINGIALAHRLLWRRSPALFWLASASIVMVGGYLIGTGAAEDIVRFLWPVPFDPVKTKEFERHAPCQGPRILGLFLLMGPMMPIILGAVLHYKIKHAWPTLVFSVCSLLLYISPLPEKLAHLALPEEVLKLPSHCAQATPRAPSLAVT